MKIYKNKEGNLIEVSDTITLDILNWIERTIKKKERPTIAMLEKEYKQEIYAPILQQLINDGLVINNDFHIIKAWTAKGDKYATNIFADMETEHADGTHTYVIRAYQTNDVGEPVIHVGYEVNVPNSVLIDEKQMARQFLANFMSDYVDTLEAASLGLKITKKWNPNKDIHLVFQARGTTFDTKTVLKKGVALRIGRNLGQFKKGVFYMIGKTIKNIEANKDIVSNEQLDTRVAEEQARLDCLKTIEIKGSTVSKSEQTITDGEKDEKKLQKHLAKEESLRNLAEANKSTDKE